MLLSWELLFVEYSPTGTLPGVVCTKHKEGEETRCPWSYLKWPWIAVQNKSYSEGKVIHTQLHMSSSERKIILVLFERAGNLIPSATALIGQGLKS